MAAKKHTVEVVKPHLQIDEELRLHEKGWVVQRIGWVLMILTMVAGLLGAFGEGLFSKKEVTQNDLKVSFEKLFRYETEMKILIESTTQHISNFSLPQHYLEKFRLLRIIPEPLNNGTINNEVVFHFSPGQNKVVSIYLVPKDYGNITGRLKLNGMHSFSLNHFIYP